MNEAIYSGGVFRPLGEVDLADNQRVRLSVQAAPASELERWLDEARGHREGAFRRTGILSESTVEIAEDRARDD